MGELRPPHSYGNFKDPDWRSKQRAARTARVNQVRGRSEGHLALVRKLPCILCGERGNTEAHHLLDTGKHERGAARRSSDRDVIPLCGPWGNNHHARLHLQGSKNERTWLASFGLDGRLLASGLWNNTGSLEQMYRVWLTHFEGVDTDAT